MIMKIHDYEMYVLQAKKFSPLTPSPLKKFKSSNQKQHWFFSVEYEKKTQKYEFRWFEKKWRRIYWKNIFYYFWIFYCEYPYLLLLLLAFIFEFSGCLLLVKWLAIVSEVFSLFNFLPPLALDVEKTVDDDEEMLLLLLLWLFDEDDEEHDDEDEADDGLHMVERGGESGG